MIQVGQYNAPSEFWAHDVLNIINRDEFASMRPEVTLNAIALTITCFLPFHTISPLIFNPCKLCVLVQVSPLHARHRGGARDRHLD
jgi:hypothetical protein